MFEHSHPVAFFSAEGRDLDGCPRSPFPFLTRVPSLQEPVRDSRGQWRSDDFLNNSDSGHISVFGWLGPVPPAKLLLL